MRKSRVVTVILRTSFLRNVLLACLGIAIVFPLYNVYFAYPSFIKLLIDDTEDTAVRTAEHLGQMLNPENEDLSRASISTDFLNEVQKLKKDFLLEDLKVFLKSGEVIYASNPKEIGTINSKIYFNEVVAKGKTFTKRVAKNTQTAEGRVVTSDVVETYVPMLRKGAFTGAFEIYYDITARSQNLSNLLSHSISINLAIASCLLLAVIAILYKAGCSAIERNHADQALQKANEELEQRVADRTASLNAASEDLQGEIAERKQAEELLRVAVQLWQSTFDAIKDMIVIVRRDRHIVQMNQAVREAFPRLGLESHCYEVFHGTRVLPEGCISCNVFDTNRPVVSEYYDPRSKKWFELYVYPISNEDGKVEQLVHVFKDVTQQMQDKKEREELASRLQRSEKMEIIGVVAGGVAHDLNNILSGIINYPELLLIDLPEGSPLRKPLVTIQQCGQKASVIVQDLLTLARRGVVVNEAVNLNEIVSEYLKSPELDGLRMYHPSVQIEAVLKHDLLNVLGSPIHLSKTVMNLVSNAAEAIGERTGTVKISLDHAYIDEPIKGYDWIEEGDYVVLTVSDNGKGIAAQDINRIFEPFFSKKKMGRSGTGLGMAVVWGTVKDHKGYIDVKSTEGKGTTFSLYFPVTRKETVERAAAPSLDGYTGKGAILVVDDVKEQREIAGSMLTRLGYEVTAVSSGEEAVEYVKENKSDLIVLDMIMDPGIDGLDTYRQILEFHPNQRAIIASGFSETDRVKEALSAGAGRYLKKPYTLEGLGFAVKEELAK